MQTILPLKRSSASLTYKPADISEFAESKFTRVTKIYIFAVGNMGEKTTKHLRFFFPKQTDYIFLPFYCYLTNVYS